MARFAATLMLIFLPVLALAEPRLKIISDEYPPYQITVGGQLRGFSTEVVSGVLDSLQVDFELIPPVSWRRALKMLETGRADALFSANFNPNRLAYAHYPEEPIIVSPWYIWQQGSNPEPYNGLDSLKDKRIGVVQGYTYTTEFWDFIRRYGLVYDKRIYDDRANLALLSKGVVDYAVAEFGNGLYLKRELALDVKAMRQHPIKADGLYVIFNRKSVTMQFVRAFSEKLRQFKESKEYQEIYRKYFSE